MMSIAPTAARCHVPGTPSRISELRMRAISTTPSTVPSTDPLPPKIDAPPSTDWGDHVELAADELVRVRESHLRDVNEPSDAGEQPDEQVDEDDAGHREAAARARTRLAPDCENAAADHRVAQHQAHERDDDRRHDQDVSRGRRPRRGP